MVRLKAAENICSERLHSVRLSKSSAKDLGKGLGKFSFFSFSFLYPRTQKRFDLLFFSRCCSPQLTANSTSLYSNTQHDDVRGEERRGRRRKKKRRREQEENDFSRGCLIHIKQGERVESLRERGSSKRKKNVKIKQ